MKPTLKIQIRNSLLYLVCILLASSCKVQSVQKNKPLDYVVLIDSDTLYGKVDYFRKGNQYGGETFYNKLRLKDSNGRKKRFKYKNVASFSINNDEYESFFLTVKRETFSIVFPATTKYVLDESGTQFFFKVKHKGKLSHYELDWFDEYNNNLWSFDIIKKAEDLFFLRADAGPFLGLKSKVLINYFSDCLDIQKKIKQKHFKYTFEVVDYYNKNCVKE